MTEEIQGHLDIPNLEQDLANLQEQLAAIPDALPQEDFSALAKSFFDTPPATSIRKAERVTRIRRKRIRKILDAEVEPTDAEVSALTDFIMKELDLLGIKRQKRLQKMQKEEVL